MDEIGEPVMHTLEERRCLDLIDQCPGQQFGGKTRLDVRGQPTRIWQEYDDTLGEQQGLVNAVGDQQRTGAALRPDV